MPEPDQLHEQSAAESAPSVRRIAKFVTGVSAFALWIAAIWMSLSAMLALSAGEPIYVVTAVIALALACDLWVGSAPIVLRSASAWGLRKWAWVGVVTLILALGMTTYNKISFWEGRSAQEEVRALQLGADPAAGARELVRANTGARVPEAVQGELDGAIARREAKRLEISTLSDAADNELRRRRSIRELGAIETEIGKLRAELASAEAVAAAQLAVAEADAQALAMRQAQATKQPQPLWLHVALAIVHEALQLVMLSFATLRIPGSVLESETQRIILARQVRLNQRVKMVSLAMDEVRQLKTAKRIFRRQRKHLPEIATRRADLEAARHLFEVEIEEKRFQAERALVLRGELEPAPEGLQIADQRDKAPIQNAPYVRESIVMDAETGLELRRVKGHYRRYTGKKNGVRTAELVEPGPILPDEPASSQPGDPRLPPVAAPVAVEPMPEPMPEQEPEAIETAPEPIEPLARELTIEAILERGRSGALLSDEEIAALAQAGAVELDERGQWREVAR